MYDMIEKYLEDILHTQWMSDKGSLALFGGIMINCDEEGTGRFLPLKFEIRTKAGAEDMFEATFGKRQENILHPVQGQM